MNNNKEEINPLDFEHLYDSMCKCTKGVMWKDSVSGFRMNGIENVLKLSKALEDGTYKPKPVKRVLITHPKKREAVSIAFVDRVYQRSLNDNVVYPAMTNGFIYDNAACQKGKGTDFARNRLKRHMQKHYREYGLDGYVLQCDVRHYYDNMRHDKTEELFRKKLDGKYADMVCKILNEQYLGDTGYNPGSQVVQIAGISVLDKLDHKIKEVLRIKYYLRYMDDFILIHHDKEYLEHCMEFINKELAEIGLELHPKKTKIYPIKDGIKMLGFKFRLTETGGVVVSVLSDNVKMERRKLSRMVKKAKRGEITKQKVDECYEAWKAHVRYGNSHNLIKRMNKFYIELWREENAGKKDTGSSTAA